jgi:hypothetical protein
MALLYGVRSLVSAGAHIVFYLYFEHVISHLLRYFNFYSAPLSPAKLIARSCRLACTWRTAPATTIIF